MVKDYVRIYLKYLSFFKKMLSVLERLKKKIVLNPEAHSGSDVATEGTGEVPSR
jgi:hypothetical protein